ncbi:MAG: hypothetical protein ACREHG_05090, partial [Candidatus Saccharimonadales bacterium]
SITLSVTDERTSKTISAYLSAVSRYLTTGLDSWLRDFRGKSIVVGGKRYHFLTNTDRLEKMENTGELKLQYASGRQLGRFDEDEEEQEPDEGSEEERDAS